MGIDGHVHRTLLHLRLAHALGILGIERLQRLVKHLHLREGNQSVLRHPALAFGPEDRIERNEGHGADHGRHGVGGLRAETLHRVADQRKLGIHLGLANSLDRVVRRIVVAGQETLASRRHLEQADSGLQRVARGFCHCPGRTHRIAGTGLAELTLLQLGIEAEVVGDHAFTGGSGHPARHVFEVVEAEGRRAIKRRGLDQPQRNTRLEAQRARIAGEHAGEVRSIPAKERHAICRCRRTRPEQFAIRQHDVEAQYGIG